jgi:hypothetical protein
VGELLEPDELEPPSDELDELDGLAELDELGELDFSDDELSFDPFPDAAAAGTAEPVRLSVL